MHRNISESACRMLIETVGIKPGSSIFFSQSLSPHNVEEVFRDLYTGRPSYFQLSIHCMALIEFNMSGFGSVTSLQLRTVGAWGAT